VHRQFLTAIVNLKFIIIAMICSALGIFFIFLSTAPEWDNSLSYWTPMKGSVNEIGNVLLVTGILTFAWEVWGRRSFADEMLERAGIAKQLSTAGIKQVTDSFQSAELDWGSLFKNASSIDLFFSYAQTWRNQRIHDFEAMLKRQNSLVRVVLPSYEDDQTVEELARRYSYDKSKMHGILLEAVDYFKNLEHQFPGKVKVWLLPAAPRFTYYRFDRTALIAPFGHRKNRAPVPTIVCAEDGTLFQFASNEFEAMVAPKDGLAKELSLKASVAAFTAAVP
jgi:hypothetical protein